MVFKRKKMSGGDSEDDLALTSAKRARVLRACAICRTRKTKCDGDLPACCTCVRLNTPCRYLPSKKRGPPKGFHSATANLLAGLATAALTPEINMSPQASGITPPSSLRSPSTDSSFKTLTMPKHPFVTDNSLQRAALGVETLSRAAAQVAFLSTSSSPASSPRMPSFSLSPSPIFTSFSPFSASGFVEKDFSEGLSQSKDPDMQPTTPPSPPTTPLQPDSSPYTPSMSTTYSTTACLRYLLQLSKENLLSKDRVKEFNRQAKSPKMLALFEAYADNPHAFIKSLQYLQADHDWIFITLEYIRYLQSSRQIVLDQAIDIKQRLLDNDQSLKMIIEECLSCSSSSVAVAAEMFLHLWLAALDKTQMPRWALICLDYISRLTATNQLTPEQALDLKKRVQARDGLLMVVVTHMPTSEYTPAEQSFLRAWIATTSQSNSWKARFVDRVLRLSSRLGLDQTNMLLQRVTYGNSDDLMNIHQVYEDDDDFVEMYQSVLGH